MKLMIRITVLLALTLGATTILADTDYKVGTGSKAISFRVSGDAEMNARLFLSQQTVLLLGLGYRQFYFEGDDASSSTYFNGVENVTTTYRSKFSRERTDSTVFAGVRRNFVAGQATLFLDSVIELIYRKTKFSRHTIMTDSSQPTPNIQTSDNSLDGVGGALVLSFGAEYFLTPQLTVEGKLDARFQYIKLKGEGISDSQSPADIAATDKSFNIYTSGVSINYYW